MPLNVFDSTSGNTENKTDASLVVQKSYLRTNLIESIIEENNDLKNQFEIKNLASPLSP